MNVSVSVITPSFNQAAYLEQTIQSVLGQDLPIEYWVMDGGSQDGSVEIIRRYANRLAGWVSEPDAGQADAVNKGLLRASGDVIGWLNSDDLYQPGAARRALQAFEQNTDAALVFGDVWSLDGAGKVINQMRYGAWGLQELMTFHIVGQPGVWIRRSALLAMAKPAQGEFLDLSYHYLLDHQLWLRLAQMGSMLYLGQPMAAARFHPAAKNVAHAAAFGQEAYRIVDWMQLQPGLQALFAANRRAIWGGAHRINARYLLDGGQPGAALRAYGRGLRCYAPAVLPELHRMVFCLLSLAGLGRLENVYRRLKRRRYEKGR